MTKITVFIKKSSLCFFISHIGSNMYCIVYFVVSSKAVQNRIGSLPFPFDQIFFGMIFVTEMDWNASLLKLIRPSWQLHV